MKTLFVDDVSPTMVNSELFRAINMINLECALTDSDHPIEKIGSALKAPKKTAECIASN